MSAGELSSGRKAKAHPLDWYVEQGWEWAQIVGAIGLEEQREGVAIWDPACGYGHSGSWLQAEGFTGRIILSDLVNNVAWSEFSFNWDSAYPKPEFFDHDFVEDVPPAIDGPVSIWCNPPYSDIRPWVEKAWAEWPYAELIVMLLPANRTEQGWWQELVEPVRDQLGYEDLRTEFLAGRLRFVAPGADGVGPNERPPFGCVLLIWEKA